MRQWIPLPAGTVGLAGAADAVAVDSAAVGFLQATSQVSGATPADLAEVAAGVDATALAAVPVVLEEGRADLVGDLAVLAVVPVASDAAAAPLFSRRFRMI